MNQNILQIGDSNFKSLKNRHQTTLNKCKLDTRENIIKTVSELTRVDYYFHSGSLVMHYFKNFVIENTDTKERFNIFEVIFNDENKITIDQIYDEKDNVFRKSIVYSLLFTYYFTHGNYKKIINLFQKFEKESDTVFYEFETSRNYNSPSANFISLRTYLISLLYTKKDNRKKIKDSYIDSLRRTAEVGYLDEFLSDPATLIMHQKIMKDEFENSKTSVKIANHKFSWNPTSLVDYLETSPFYLEEFLYKFNSDNYWGIITSRNSYAIRDYLDELDSNKERLIRIFNNYLYTKYAAGQKYGNLENIITAMNNMINVLGYEEYGILDIVDGLPEKIQRAALKTLVGE